MKHNLKHKLTLLLVIPITVFILFLGAAPLVAATSPCLQAPIPSGTYCCGDSSNGGPVQTSIDLGCRAQGNPIMDMSFAIIRLLSDGVGIVVVASVIVA